MPIRTSKSKNSSGYLVLVHASWCPHCPTKNKMARDTWKQIQKKVPRSVAVEESDGKRRLATLMRHVKFFPTVLFVSSKNSVKVMNGPFTRDNVLRFYQQYKETQRE